MNDFDRGSNLHIVAELRKENASLKQEIESLKEGLRLKDKALISSAEENLVLESEVKALESKNNELLAEVKSWTIGFD